MTVITGNFQSSTGFQYTEAQGSIAGHAAVLQSAFELSVLGALGLINGGAGSN